MNHAIVKKFYRDFSDEEKNFFNEIIHDIGEMQIEVPDYVVERMIDRRILPEDLPIYDENDKVDESKIYFLNTIPQYLEVMRTLLEGAAYEVSNEGLNKSNNPFRLVIAREAEDGSTYFVKIAPTLDDDEFCKVLDVWKRRGKIPLYPPSHALNQFVADWDVIDAMESFFEEKHVPAPRNVTLRTLLEEPNRNNDDDNGESKIAVGNASGI